MHLLRRRAIEDTGVLQARNSDAGLQRDTFSGNHISNLSCDRAPPEWNNIKNQATLLILTLDEIDLLARSWDWKHTICRPRTCLEGVTILVDV